MTIANHYDSPPPTQVHIPVPRISPNTVPSLIRCTCARRLNGSSPWHAGANGMGIGRTGARSRHFGERSFCPRSNETQNRSTDDSLVPRVLAISVNLVRAKNARPWQTKRRMPLVRQIELCPAALGHRNRARVIWSRFISSASRLLGPCILASIAIR